MPKARRPLSRDEVYGPPLGEFVYRAIPEALPKAKKLAHPSGTKSASYLDAKRFVEADAEDTDEIRRLSGDMDGDMDNETDSSNATDSDPAVPEILTLAMSLNGVRPTCKASFCGLNLTDEATPTVSAVLPLKGSYADGTDVVLTVSSMKEFSRQEPEQVQVYFGETECPNAVVSGAMGDWRVTVPLCSFEASKVPVHLLTSSGYAAKASPFTGASFHFEQELRLTSVTPSSGSFYGGTLATIAGAGLGATTAANYATVGGTPCQVTAASNDQISCYVPPAAAELATGDVAARTMEAAVKVLSASVATEPGLKGEYFFFTQGSTLPSLDGRVPDLTRTDSTINFADTSQVWDANLPSSTHFAVRWTGYITVQSSGDYTFYLGSDDGSQLFLDGSLVVDNDGTHGFRTRTSVPQTLAAHSMHMVTVLFFQTIGSHGVRLQYLGPDTGGQVLLVPSSVLSHGSFEQAPTLSYVYDSPDSAPFIENLTEAGATLTLEGANFGADGKVALGSATNPDLNFLCTVTSWSATNIICSRPELPSGAWQVRVHTAMGWSNVAPLLVWVELTVTSVEANGVNVSAASATTPWVLVMKFSEGGLLGYDSELWSNAELLNPDSPEDMPGNAKYQAYMDTPFKRLRACVGTAYGSCVSHSFDSAYSSASALFTAGYVRDFSVDQGGLIQALGAKPGTYQACPMLSPGFNLECDSANKARWGFCANCPNQQCRSARAKCKGQVRSFSGNVTWTEIASARSATTTGASIAQGWTSYPVQGPEGENSSVVAQAFRVRVLPDACNSAGELMRGVRFRGILLSTGNASACPIEVEAVSHPLASATGGSARLPVTLSYSLARTPVVTALTPSRGTARGDTLVTLLGEGLDPLDANGDAATVAADNANIMLNGYSCLPQEANSSALSCMTTERNAGIQAPSTEVFLAGRGYAIISERSEDTVFKYVDRWSNIYSWLDSEPPVDGDSVIVPEGQAIMLDVNSPKLFLLLIMGYFEFDRKDLSLDSTYIWIAGGHFFVGSEEAPFLQQATITLHGDRWNTIELPVIGSKRLERKRARYTEK
ncbi:unnamed protein product [Effrenium voratum]|nr:unnamed protein product [Effrenium voratum]